MTAYASVDTAIEAMKQGAADYITKPFKVDEIKLVIEKIDQPPQTSGRKHHAQAPAPGRQLVRQFHRQSGIGRPDEKAGPTGRRDPIRPC